MEWIVSIGLIIISILIGLLEGKVCILFIIPAIIFSPIVLDFLYDKGIYISNTIKWIGIFIFCIIGAIIITNKELEAHQNVEIINPMDGLVLNETKIMTIDDGNNQYLESPTPVISEITYQVEYYYDGKLVTSATDTLVGKTGDIIKEYKDKSLELYKVEKTENLPLELIKSEDKLVIKIYYVKKPAEVSYCIRYYYDGIIDSSKTKYLTGSTGDIIKEYPPGDKEGYIPIKAINLPLQLTENEETNEIKVYYGFAENTIMEELGLVEGFAPAVLLKKEDPEDSSKTIDQYKCPYCESIYDENLLEIIDETKFKCPFCEKEVLISEEGKIYDEEGNEVEEIIDNAAQQKIPEKYALDTKEHLIHNPLCYKVRQIPSENFAGSNDSLEILQNKGYKICKKCNPKEDIVE